MLNYIQYVLYQYKLLLTDVKDNNFIAHCRDSSISTGYTRWVYPSFLRTGPEVHREIAIINMTEPTM